MPKSAPKHSARFDTVKRFYERGTWPLARVTKAVECNWITAEEFAEITGEEFVAAE